MDLRRLCLIGAAVFLLSVGSAHPEAQHRILDQAINRAPHQHRVKVPGQSPAFHCNDPLKDIFQISSLDIEPNPPQA